MSTRQAPRQHPVGERFVYMGVTLETKEDVPTGHLLRCTGCYFLRDPYCGNGAHTAGDCVGTRRTDGRYVKFIKVRQQP